MGVTDAKDCFDRVTSDTGFGSQKSLMFSVAGLRQQLRRPQASLRWTATSNMLVDAGTKAMDGQHLREALLRGEWSVEFQQDFVKQTAKRKKASDKGLADGMVLPGREAGSGDFQLMQHVHHLAQAAGWHFVDGIGILVAHQAKSFRGPTPRFALRDHPLRTSVAEFRTQDKSTWQVLEERVDLMDMAVHQGLLPMQAKTLVTFFEPRGSRPQARENKTDEKRETCT